MGRPKSEKRTKLLDFLRAAHERDKTLRFSFADLGDVLEMNVKERNTGQLSTLLSNMVAEGLINREGERKHFGYWLGDPLTQHEISANRREHRQATAARMSPEVARAIRTPLVVEANVAGYREPVPFRAFSVSREMSDALERTRAARAAAPSKGDEQ